MRIARGISVSNTSRPVGMSYDADAAAFFTAASITDTTQKSAVNILVLSLKSANIWTKMKALYPVVGGVASAHAVNLKQPGTYNLSFATGWTHSSTGMTPNGATYANTFLTPSTVLGVNSASMSYYSITNSAIVNEVAMGVLNGSTGGSGLNLVIRRDTNLNSFRATEIGASNGLINSTSTDSRGLTSGSIISATSRKLYKNGILLATNSSNYNWDRSSNNIILGAAYNTSTFLADFFTNKQCAFASIGDGLTDAETFSFYTAVQTYQTTLGRQV
jgi:hypothetical protein